MQIQEGLDDGDTVTQAAPAVQRPWSLGGTLLGMNVVALTVHVSLTI